jgi:hypothetical protein
MALSKQSVALTQLGGGQYQVSIGPETFLFSGHDVRALWNGERALGYLLFQFLIVLQQAGVNPNTATFAQVQSAIQAQTYWWGN